MKPLTPRQLSIYRFLIAYVTANHGWPTFREIGKAAGMRSPNGVATALEAITKKGWIARRHVGGKNAFRFTVVKLEATEAEAPGLAPAGRGAYRPGLMNERTSEDVSHATTLDR